MRIKRKIKKAALLLLASCIAAGSIQVAEAHHHRNDSTTVVTRDKALKSDSENVNRTDPKAQPDKGPLPVAEVGHAKNGAEMEQVMHMWPVVSKDTGGTLIFSDSPEYVQEDGILYEDTVSGDARVLFYHLNNTSEQKKVAVMLQNEGDAPVIIKVTRGGLSDPNEDYLAVGKRTQIEYFARNVYDVMYVRSHGKRLLRRKMNEKIIEPGQLTYGVFDFNASKPVKVSVIMYPADMSPYEFMDRARVLPKDEQRLRGTFKGMDRVISSTRVYDPDKDGAVYFPIGDNLQDLYRTGIDATDGSKVTDFGNYGVLYKIEIPTTGKSFVKYYLSPLGGVYAGAMTASQPGEQGCLLLTPHGKPFFGDETPPETEEEQRSRENGTSAISGNTELADLGTYQNGRQVSFEYSPPGASNLPVNIIMMPSR